ncbi:unnamed protein product [Didymodactylos carnosus]|uniref:Ig-like domain-containing protein n=1 Tax=Didymodactylos carnosus TaxID=1234261 RepID=A0A813TYX3_9BILA|nr:unnamed protein product [Didymodactylos carnosus]CAF0815223.1 unnamed protein product [Didymodactylos carnosus]CAF3542893.1 unnamed protein product [Didymodactylos carnosus]CAF3601274.1 unnamed protein product [Didymodactylos carnosus]
MRFYLLLLLFGLTAEIVLSTILLATSSRELTFRENRLYKRLVKRQLQDCIPENCAVPNCGRDFVAMRLPNECCEKCVRKCYQSIAQQNPQAPQTQYGYDRYPYQNQPQYQQPQYQQPQYQQPQYQQPRVDVYIFGPDDGAKVSEGQSIYFDCEVVAPYQQNIQPRWLRQGNQPLPFKARSSPLEGNRKIVRLAIADATASDAGRYECSAGTGNPADQASIDLQVTAGGQYPRPAQPAPYNPYGDQSGYNQQYPYYPPSNYPQPPQQPSYPYDTNPYPPAQPNPPPYNDPYNQPGYPYSNENQPQPRPETNDDQSGTNEDANNVPRTDQATTPPESEKPAPSEKEPDDDAGAEYDGDYDDENAR